MAVTVATQETTRRAFLVKTHERPHVCQRLLDSIRARFDWPIYVADDSREPTAYADSTPNTIDVPVGHDCGLSAGRNALVDACQEDIVVLLDDDFVIRPDTNFSPMFSLLDAADIVGGCLAMNDRPYHFEGHLRWDPSTGKLHTGSNRHVSGPVFCDIVLNFFAARRETLAEYRWPDWLKLGEHNEFFLVCQGWDAGTEERAINEITRPALRVAYQPATMADHVPFRSPEYEVVRYPKAAEYRRRWYEWRGIREICGDLGAGRVA